MYENCAVEAVVVRLLTCPLFLSSLLPILLVKLFDDPELQPLAGALASSAHEGCFCKAGDCLLRAVARPGETAEMMRRAKDLRETLSAAKKRMGRAVPKKKTAGGSGKAVGMKRAMASSSSSSSLSSSSLSTTPGKEGDEDGAPVVRKRKVIFDPSIGRKLQHQNALEEFVDQMMREHYHRSECTLANEKT